MKTLITNISQLLHIEQHGRKYKRGAQLNDFPLSSDCWLLIDGEKIHSWGKMSSPLPDDAERELDAAGGIVLPTWVDSHTHLVYAGTREDEFAKRLAGKSYAEIAAEGGGILNSADKLQNSSEDELYEVAAQRLHELIMMGTGAVEIKSGYGLSTESEIKMLKVARRLAQNFPLPIRTTFLGAHAIPRKYARDREAYIRLIIDEMIPEISRLNLADYVDVFCEEGYFSIDEMLEIMAAGQKYNLKSKLHLNQFNALGAIGKAINNDALSVDHLEVLAGVNAPPLPGDINEAALLGKSETIATLLPGCSLFLEIPYAPARSLIEHDAIVALASDYNPGSAPSGNMNLCVSLACIKMKMKPEEAISAATLNGAAALELSAELGSIEKGKLANLIISRPLSSYAFLPYNFGHNHIRHTMIKGKIYEGNA